MALKPVDLGPRTLADQVYGSLRSRILAGEFEPGQRLRIREVAASFEVSTMPVRVAINRLASAGLVTAVAHQGAVVTELSVSVLDEFYDIRIMLEPEAARRGLERITDEDKPRLLDLLAQMRASVESNDNATTLGLDEQFLLHIYTAAGNDELVRIIESIWSRVAPYKLLYTATREFAARRSLECDELLLAAAEAGDSARGAEIVRESLVEARAELTRVISRELPAERTQ